MAHTREDVLGMLSAPVKWLKAFTLKECRQRERLRQLWDFLESTADATFGVQQPNSRFPESERNLYENMRLCGNAWQRRSFIYHQRDDDI